MTDVHLLIADPDFAERVAERSPWQLAATTPGVSAEVLRSLDAELAELAALDDV